MTQYSGVFSLQQQGQALTSGQWCTDPYFKNTTLLLHADNVSGSAQNNTFVDSSTNGFAITRNGNTTQGSFTPYGPTWSNCFDTANTILAVGSTTSTGNFTTGTDFTIELWFCSKNTTAGVLIAKTRWFGDTNDSWFVSTNGSGYVSFDIYASGATTNTTLLTGTSSVHDSKWHHIAITRSGTTYYLFVDGVQQATTTNATALNQGTAANITIAGITYNGGNYGATGYYSNVRILKGTALYTSNFAPSTVPLTAITNTFLLTCKSNQFVDISATASAITTSGSPSVQRFSPFAPQYQYTPAVIGGSGYFDGSGDYLSVSQLAGNFGTSSWSIECYYCNSVAYSGTVYPRIVSKSITSNISGAWGLGTRNGTTNEVWFSYNTGSGFTDVSTGVNVNDFAWHHLLATYDGSRIRVFVDGVLRANAVPTISSFGTATGDPVLIGYQSRDGHYINGYVNDLRIVNGSIPTSYQTASTTNGTSIFTPPTAPVTTSSQGATSGNVSLLTSFTNAGIYDNAMMNDLETVGNAQVSTNVVKYGSGSLAFDGSGDYLQAPHTTVAEFGSGNFTVEFWAYINAQSGAFTGVVGQWLAGASNAANSWNVSTNLYNTTNKLGFSYSDGSATTDVSFGSALTTGTWNHYAICRSGNLLYAFKDGVLLNSGGTSITATINNGTSNLRVGSVGTTGGGSDFNGYIDDLRITKGVARYTANFQPPKVAFANQ